MKPRGRPGRGLIMPDDSKRRLKVRRLRCGKCGRFHRELPDEIVPYKRHCAETVEAVISGREEETACFESTAQRIRGWWEEIKPYLIAALGSMEVKFGVAVSIGDRLPKIVRAVCNANFWKCTRSVVTAWP